MCSALARLAHSWEPTMADLQRFIAVDNVCAWPNLTVMPDGSIVATVFNQPCHGRWEGDADSWASEDGGLTWTYRGTPARHEPGQSRMNVGGGLAKNGDLVIMCSGWDNRPPAGQAAGFGESKVTRPILSRSSDGARTWQVTAEGLPDRPVADMSELVPFGDTDVDDDGRLCIGTYVFTRKPHSRGNVYLMRSDDDGRTWGTLSRIAPDGYCEGDVLHLGGGRWLCVCRLFRGVPLHLYASNDDGHTWTFQDAVSLPGVSAPHLARLSDGRVLLSYGNRCPNIQGLDVRISEDEGRTWSRPARVVHTPADDSGYPSTVELPDGRVLTAYYASRADGHERYHMGVVIWRVDDIFAR